MEKFIKSEILKSIDVTRESIRNSMQITMESYIETLSRLELIAYMLIKKEK